MKYRIVHSTAYQYSDPVPVCHNQLRLTPRETPYTHCKSHRLLIRPVPANVSRRKDWFGNIVQSFSLDESHRKLLLTATSRVTVSPQVIPEFSQTPKWEDVADGIRSQTLDGWFDATEFVFDSSLAFSDASFRDYAVDCFGTGHPILSGAVALMSKIHREFKYDPRATTVVTRPNEALVEKHGVCQDFAHVAISCLRSLGLPARYVSGYLRTIPPEGTPRLVGADASHAWYSVWCGKAGWIDLDPTNDKVCGTGHIPIAWGRDYSDVAPIRGVFTGGGQHTLNVSVDVEPIE
ncbi:MAG: transglutaminase family protein [Planctomycetota bacterium]|nr:transglutaminase family protein [Planctomycetota bacterium]